MKRCITLLGAVAALNVAGVAQAGSIDELLLRSDALMREDNAALRAIYAAGNVAFARGDFSAAFREYDYAAWQGSLAAASRLCVLEAYGIGTAVNPLKAAFWCERAAQAGQGVPRVERHLGDAYFMGR